MKYKFMLNLAIILFGVVYCNETIKLQKCNTRKGTNKHLEEAVRTFKNCFNVSLENFRHLVTSNTCSLNFHDINRCDSKIQNTISDCRSSDIEYFPFGVLKIVKKYADYICERALAYKFSILLDHETCFPSLYHGIGCFEKFSFFNSSSVVLKFEMCFEEIEVQLCLEEYSKRYCPKDKIFSLLINQTFDYEVAPCTGSGSFENTFLVIVIALFSLVFFYDFNIVH